MEDRTLFVDVLERHLLTDGHCACGWQGEDHPNHVADMYEAALQVTKKEKR